MTRPATTLRALLRPVLSALATRLRYADLLRAVDRACP